MTRPGYTPAPERPFRVEIGSDVVVGVDDHDMARDTRIAKAIDFVVSRIVRALLRISPRTVVLANVRLDGGKGPALWINNSSSTLVSNISINVEYDGGEL